MLLFALRFRRPIDLHLLSSCPCYCICFKETGGVAVHWPGLAEVAAVLVGTCFPIPTGKLAGCQVCQQMLWQVSSSQQCLAWPFSSLWECRWGNERQWSQGAAWPRCEQGSCCWKEAWSIFLCHSGCAEHLKQPGEGSHPARVPSCQGTWVYWGIGCSYVPMLMANVLFISSYFPLKWLYHLIATKGNVLSRLGYFGWMLHL